MNYVFTLNGVCVQTDCICAWRATPISLDLTVPAPNTLSVISNTRSRCRMIYGRLGSDK